MKMIAIGTVHGRKLIKEADKANPKSKAKYEDLLAKPGDEFDTVEFGIDADEAKTLVASKAARRKTRTVVDDSESGRSPRVAGGRSTGDDQFEKLTDLELTALVADRPDIIVAPPGGRAEMLAALRAPAA